MEQFWSSFTVADLIETMGETNDVGMQQLRALQEGYSPTD